MSAIASGLSILFLFWTITHFAKKIVLQTDPPSSARNPRPEATRNHNGPSHSHPEPTRQQTITILGSGVVGALAYTFCDSFWFSAVEGEVYASSAFFTAIVFWAILK
jgi:hypothetical protein